MFRHGHTLDYVIKAIISSIPKNARDSENDRGIALSSAIGKMLDIIVTNRYSNELMSGNLQFSLCMRSILTTPLEAAECICVFGCQTVVDTAIFS